MRSASSNFEKSTEDLGASQPTYSNTFRWQKTSRGRHRISLLPFWIHDREEERRQRPMRWCA